MGLFDDLEVPVKILPCKVRTIAGTLDSKDADKLQALVADKAWPIQTLEIALAGKGVQISQNALKRHRNRACSCGEINA